MNESQESDYQSLQKLIRYNQFKVAEEGLDDAREVTNSTGSNENESSEKMSKYIYNNTQGPYNAATTSTVGAQNIENVIGNIETGTSSALDDLKEKKTENVDNYKAESVNKLSNNTTDPSPKQNVYKQQDSNNNTNDVGSNETSSEKPFYVNAKQYYRILKRRYSRARLEENLRISRERKPYLHESRHKHAMRRPRGQGGRFLTAVEIEALKQKENAKAAAIEQIPSGTTTSYNSDNAVESI